MSTPPPPDIKVPPPPSPASVRTKAARAVVATVPESARKLAESTASPSTSTAEDGARGRVSMYVTLFDDEPHYLLTRLLLRRPGKVHGLGDIAPAYSGELGEEGVRRAARVLCQALEIPEHVKAADPEPQPEPWASNGHTDSPTVESPTPAGADKPWAALPTGLTAEEELADPELAEAIRQSLWADSRRDSAATEIDTPSERNDATSGKSTPAENSSRNPLSRRGSADCSFSLQPKEREPISKLGHDETELSLREIMTSIPADDLRRVARSRKVPPSLLATRETTMKALEDVALRQKTLSFVPVDRKGKGKVESNGIKRTFSNSGTSEHLVIAQLLPCLGGHVIQIDKSLYALVARVNLVFSRTPPTSASVPALLLPPILVTSHKRHYPDYGKPTRSVIWKDRGEILTWERAVTWEVAVSEAMGDNWQDRRKAGPGAFTNRAPILSRAEGAKLVRDVWASVWPYWQELVAGDGGKAVEASENIGDRFQTGHVLTRIVYKGAEALGVLHEYDLQCEVLRALLAQRRWRRGKRGAWYDRLALVLMNHYKGTDEERREKLEDATQVCIDGLLDDDTHMIYRPGLSRRLTRLENKLNLPPEERHISYAQLLTCETRELVATRVHQNAGVVRQPNAPARKMSGDTEASDLWQVGKSVWVGRDGEVSVEGWVLEWWEAKGYSGFHAESSILTTLFALLMWPVLFHPIPGAFETFYQTAPLDLGEDTFARARRDIITERLQAMESTENALAMLKETDTRERARGTWAVGLSWDFGAIELEEILTCMGGKAMSAICRMLSEEYRHRASGVPDLIVWNYEEREARFVEVKGPGDSLSETQKVWIDVLLSSGVPVEVCRVKAKDEAPEKTLKRRLSKKPSLKKRESDPTPIEIDDDGDNDNEEDEWQYESGEEGKAEGHWERDGKRTKR